MVYKLDYMFVRIATCVVVKGLQNVNIYHVHASLVDASDAVAVVMLLQHPWNPYSTNYT